MNQPPQLIIDYAVKVAAGSPCAKSKRGVVIYSPIAVTRHLDCVFSSAHNAPPWPYECNGSDECKAHCRELAVHAEQRAVMFMNKGDGRHTPGGLHLVHVKAVDGALVAGKPPSCVQCSKIIVEASRHIDRVWLYESPGVWNSYDTLGFHRHTLLNNKLPVIL